ncbi:hypothetical protein PENTCL1PPCAC_5989, partial [Pristionchus entomophagus]
LWRFPCYKFGDSLKTCLILGAMEKSWGVKGTMAELCGMMTLRRPSSMIFYPLEDPSEYSEIDGSLDSFLPQSSLPSIPSL